MADYELVLKRTPWWHRLVLFQSRRQAMMYLAVAVPTVTGLGFAARWAIATGWLSGDAGAVISIVTAAMAGSLVHLVFLFPAELVLRPAHRLRPLVLGLLEEYGWRPHGDGSVWRYGRRWYMYSESDVHVSERAGRLVVRGPDFAMRRLARALERACSGE